ncbi:MAG TPA: hypothetical protein VFF69_04965 [Phycisphaerales bacterium]|nr:hypothetical protein [Phycisphaerales bacterium]
MHEDPNIPDRLARDLHRLDSPGDARWPADDPVLGAARRQLRGRSARRPLRLAAWSAGLAAAAGLAISAMVWLNPPARHVSARGLVERDAPAVASGPASPVTMLDAYRLALLLDHDEPAAGAWDANADGAIDRRDVDTLAVRAVSLGETAS